MPYVLKVEDPLSGLIILLITAGFASAPLRSAAAARPV
jgi:hypothetical protein